MEIEVTPELMQEIETHFGGIKYAEFLDLVGFRDKTIVSKKLINKLQLILYCILCGYTFKENKFSYTVSYDEKD